MCARTRCPAPAVMAGFRAFIVDPAAIARAGELGMAWNDERVELLKKLWSDGLSASQIAGRLGGVTRNAVIGKVHRLGLSWRATTSSIKSHRRSARAKSPRLLMNPGSSNMVNPALRQLYRGDTEPYAPPAEELVIPLNERRSIQTLTEACCRWP